jgi:hypothetical protein
VSNVPFSHGHLAFQMAANHTKNSVEHGFYQAWRIKRGIAQREPSVRADAANKHKGYAAQSAGR